VTVEFLNRPGAERPQAVLSCSIVQDARGIRCKRGCLGLADAAWTASPIMPRYALLAGSVAARPLARGAA
jgi:hypothetical protein